MAIGAFFAVAAALAGAFGGCAQGNTLGTGASGAGTATGGQGGTGGVPAGGVGSPCETAQDCDDGGQCVQVGTTKMCSFSCPPACPENSYCTLVEGDALCVPDLDQQCGQCLGSAQCKGLTDECLTAPAGDKFCARDCTTIDDCPGGMACVERAEYEAPAAAGTGGGGTGGTATTGGTGATGGTGGSGGAPMTTTTTQPPTGLPHKYCVPLDGNSCACNDKRDGVTKSCDVQNDFGTCLGSATCDGKGGAWVGCTAKTPAAETCNNDDDDCNGAVDEGEVAALCGGIPTHGTYACTAGACELGACDPGWTNYPPGTPADGCKCPVDQSEPNDICANVADAGSVSDAGGAVQIAGTLSSDADVDVWTFQSVDTDELTTNSYHVSIDVLTAEGSDVFLLDVTRGDTCSDASPPASSGITSYDWCVDGTSADGTAGEATCSAMGAVHCNNNSSKYFVRVRRKPGVQAACASYKIQISARGGDPCDFAKQCQ